MTDPRWTSPLAHRQSLNSGDALRMAETPYLGLLILRGDAAEIGDAATGALGAALPANVGETSNGSGASAMWLAPDEWLIVAPDGPEALRSALDQALSGLHRQVVDVSDYYTAIDVRGAKAREALSKLMTTDLHPRVFSAGRAIATGLAKAQIWFWMLDDESGEGPSVRIFIRRSLADYVWDLLIEAGREWAPSEGGA